MAVGENGFYDPRKTGRSAARLLLVIMVFEVIYAAYTVYFMQFLNALDRLTEAEIDARAVMVDDLGSAVSFGYIAAYLVCCIVSGMWIYRVTFNARAVAPAGSGPSPGWGVGWFFVPILSLWKPYQSMKRVWELTGPGEPGAGPPGYVAWWWALWVLANILGNISSRINMRADDVDAYMVGSVLDLVNFPISLGCAWLFRRVVLALTDTQTELYEGTGGRTAEVFA